MPSRIDEKLRAKGYNPDEIKASLNRYIGEGKAFGSPEKYKRAIKDKEAAGESLQDPVTAQAFQQAVAPEMGPRSTEFNFGGGAMPQVEGIQPKAQEMLGAAMQYQQDHPISLPVAPGTPTRWQTQDALAEEQWRKQWARDEERYQQEWDYMVQQDEISNQLAWAQLNQQSAGTSGVTDGMDFQPMEEVRKIVDMGGDPDDVQSYIWELQGYGILDEIGIDPEVLLNVGLNEIQVREGEVARQATRDLEHGGHPALGLPDHKQEQYETAIAEAMARAEEARAFGEPKEQYPKYTEEDYERFSAKSPLTVEQFRMADQMGTIDDLLTGMMEIDAGIR